MRNPPSACDRIEERLFEGGELSKRECAHLEACPSCCEVVTMTKKMTEELEDTRAAQLRVPQWIAMTRERAARRHRSLRLATGAAAAGMVATAATALALWSPGEHGERAGIAAAHDTPSAPTLQVNENREPTPAPGERAPFAPDLDPPIHMQRDLLGRYRPFSGSCVDADHGGVRCAGASSLLPAREEAREQARDVALEALAVHIAERSTSSYFSVSVWPTYAPIRQELSRRYREDETDGEAYRLLADARKRAAEALRSSARGRLFFRGNAWLEYAAEPPDAGSEFLGYAQVEVSAANLEALVDVYSRSVELDSGGRAAVAFPLLAYAYPSFDGGVILTEPPASLPGAETGSLLHALNEKPIRTTRQLEYALEQTIAQWSHVRLYVKAPVAPLHPEYLRPRRGRRSLPSH